MKQLDLTAEEVRALLQRAVDEKGTDYVYPEEEKREVADLGPTCLYFTRPGVPSCIVGHVLHYAGVAEAREGDGAYLEGRKITQDHRILEALGAAQQVQDGGGTWGEALAAFDRELAQEG